MDVLEHAFLHEDLEDCGTTVAILAAKPAGHYRIGTEDVWHVGDGVVIRGYRPPGEPAPIVRSWDRGTIVYRLGGKEATVQHVVAAVEEADGAWTVEHGGAQAWSSPTGMTEADAANYRRFLYEMEWYRAWQRGRAGLGLPPCEPCPPPPRPWWKRLLGME